MRLCVRTCASLFTFERSTGGHASATPCLPNQRLIIMTFILQPSSALTIRYLIVGAAGMVAALVSL